MQDLNRFDWSKKLIFSGVWFFIEDSLKLDKSVVLSGFRDVSMLHGEFIPYGLHTLITSILFNGNTYLFLFDIYLSIIVYKIKSFLKSEMLQKLVK